MIHRWMMAIPMILGHHMNRLVMPNQMPIHKCLVQLKIVADNWMMIHTIDWNRMAMKPMMRMRMSREFRHKGPQPMEVRIHWIHTMNHHKDLSLNRNRHRRKDRKIEPIDHIQILHFLNQNRMELVDRHMSTRILMPYYRMVMMFHVDRRVHS